MATAFEDGKSAVFTSPFPHSGCSTESTGASFPLHQRDFSRLLQFYHLSSFFLGQRFHIGG
jgi:hypothetical protein